MSLKVVDVEPPSVEWVAMEEKGKKNKSGKRSRSFSEDEEVEEDAQFATKTLVVIKMKKWDLTLGSEGNVLDFRKGKFNASLVFAQDHSEVVERKGGTVLSCKFAPSKTGTTCAVEVLIGVLSSQLGGMFRIVFTFGDKESCTSDVIKVVSKKSQLEKEEKPKRVRTTQIATREAVLELIEEVRSERQKNEQMMELIIEQNKSLQHTLSSTMTMGMYGGVVSGEEEKDRECRVRVSIGDETPEADSFVHSQDSVDCVDVFQRSLRSLATLNPLQRQNAIKQLSENFTQQDMLVFSELSAALAPAPPSFQDDYGSLLLDSDCRAKLQLSGLELW